MPRGGAKHHQHRHLGAPGTRGGWGVVGCCVGSRLSFFPSPLRIGKVCVGGSAGGYQRGRLAELPRVHKGDEEKRGNFPSLSPSPGTSPRLLGSGGCRDAPGMLRPGTARHGPLPPPAGRTFPRDVPRPGGSGRPPAKNCWWYLQREIARQPPLLKMLLPFTAFEANRNDFL